MDYVERATCENGSVTGFAVMREDLANDEVLIRFVPQLNFSLVKTSWRQVFTDKIVASIAKESPGKAVTFAIR